LNENKLKLNSKSSMDYLSIKCIRPQL